MRLFAVPYRVTVCVAGVDVYCCRLECVCDCSPAFLSNILVSRIQCVCVCAVFVCVYSIALSFSSSVALNRKLTVRFLKE